MNSSPAPDPFGLPTRGPRRGIAPSSSPGFSNGLRSRVLASLPFHATRVHPGPRRSLWQPPLPWWLLFLGVSGALLALLAWKVYEARYSEKVLRAAVRGPKLGEVGARAQLSKESAPAPERVHQSLKESAEPPVLPPVDVPPPPPPPPLETAPPVVAPPVVAPVIVDPPKELPPKVDLPPPVMVPPLGDEPPVVKAPPLEVPPPVIIPPPTENILPAARLEPAERDEQPLVFSRASDPGDTPMLRNWKTLALYSLTVVTLAQPVDGQEKQEKVVERLDNLEQSIKKSFEELGKDIRAMSADLGAFKKDLMKVQSDVSVLQADGLKSNFVIEGLRKDIEALKKQLENGSRISPIDKAAVEDVKLRLSAIEKAILSLQPGLERVARTGVETPKGGRVMLVNNYPEMLLFVLNGREVRVPAMSSQVIEDVPAGSLNYEAISPTWGLRARRTTTLAPGETFTLTAQ